VTGAADGVAAKGFAFAGVAGAAPVVVGELEEGGVLAVVKIGFAVRRRTHDRALNRRGRKRHVRSVRLQKIDTSDTMIPNNGRMTIASFTSSFR
jgi:hypothetical protein